jgi:hypothetical protein
MFSNVYALRMTSSLLNMGDSTAPGHRHGLACFGCLPGAERLYGVGHFADPCHVYMTTAH